MILTGSLCLQCGSPLCQQAKLLLQAVHHPLPLCHHSIQLGLDPAHHMRPDLVQRARQVVQQVFHLAALSVSVALKHRRVQMFGEERATTPSSSTCSTRPPTGFYIRNKQVCHLEVVQLLLQLRHTDLLLLDPVQDLLLGPGHLFLKT